MKAKTAEQYTEEWTNHVRQLMHVYLDAGIDWEIWERDFEDMKNIINRAARKNLDNKVFTTESAA